MQKEQFINPKVRVTGINHIEQLDNNALEEDINLRNFINFDKKCRILHAYTNGKINLQSVILQVTA